MRTSLNPIARSHFVNKMNFSKTKEADIYANAMQELQEQFKKTDEIGRLEEPIIVKIRIPHKETKISEAKLKIENPKDKNDFRTRVFSMIAESEELGGGTSFVVAKGNKYAIESTLQNPETLSAFKKFIREAKKDFED